MADVTRSVDLDVAPEEVWEAIVDDDARGCWLGGQTQLDPVPGGEGYATTEDGAHRWVRVDEVDPGRRLSFRWWADDDDAMSVVELVVVPRPGGSTLTVTETMPVARASIGARIVDLELFFLLRAGLLARV